MTPMMKLMRLVGLLLLAVLGLAEHSFAQAPTITRGGALKKRAYQTYAAMTLYVDSPTNTPSIGSDSNSCMSAADPCATLGGALNKVPIHIRHAVTVNVAAGTYTEVFRVQGFYIEGANGAASTAALNITGVQSAFTVATGTNTGTLTGYVAGTGGLHGIATDSGATWTVNDLRGRYLQITGGTGSGQYMPITSNTATGISLAANFTTAPDATSTYAIVTPGPVFSSTSAGTITGNSGAATATTSGAITLSDIELTAQINLEGVAPLAITRVRNNGGSTNFFVGNNSATTVRFSGAICLSTINGVSSTSRASVAFESSYIRCKNASCSGAGISTPFDGLSGTIEGKFSFGAVFMSYPNYTSRNSTGLWVDCGDVSAVGIYQPASTNTRVPATQTLIVPAGPYFSTCATGFSLSAFGNTYVGNTATFSNVTTAISLSAGARALIQASPTFTGVTNELTIDGTVYTNADLTTFTRITGPQGSYASRP